MAQTLLLSTVLFGVALAAIVLYVSGHGWRERTSSAGIVLRRRDERSSVARAAGDPLVWTLVFVGTVVALGVATVAFVGDVASDPVRRNAGAFLVAVSALVLTLYLFYGTFVSARNRGLKNAHAAAFGSWMVGLLAVLAIVLRLFEVF